MENPNPNPDLEDLISQSEPLGWEDNFPSAGIYPH